MAIYDGGDTVEEESGINQNPIIEVSLNATPEDNFYFVENPEEQYIYIPYSNQPALKRICLVL